MNVPRVHLAKALAAADFEDEEISRETAVRK